MRQNNRFLKNGYKKILNRKNMAEYNRKQVICMTKGHFFSGVIRPQKTAGLKNYNCLLSS